jgi:hypothetical protein
VFMLDQIGTVGGVWRVRDGWLALGTDTNQSDVWFIDPTGGTKLLASGDRAIVSHGTKARPGPQVAWSRSGQLSVATVDGDHLVDIATTDGIGRLFPLLVVGDGVLLGGTGVGGSVGLWDMWFPDRGAYKPTPVGPEKLSRVLGATDDRIIALVDDMCLALLDPAGFEPVRSICGLGFGFDTTLYPSPDGSWWLVVTPDGIALYDSFKIWFSPQPERTWTRHVLSVTWLDRSSFLTTTDTELIRTFTDGTDGSRTIALPSLRQGIKLVPDLGTWSQAR